MTTLICAGTLFSDWEHVLANNVPTGLRDTTLQKKFSALSTEIYQRKFLDADELTWKTFAPDEASLDQARNLLSNPQIDSIFIYCDTNSSLFLDFWKATDVTAKFLLFYSSPEIELAKYFNTHSFDATQVESIIEAWIIRTRAMLTFFMNSRDLCLLVNVQSATIMHHSLFEKLKKHFDIDLKADSLASQPNSEVSTLLVYLATSLLLNNEKVAELYDEVRSAATVLCDQDKNLENLQSRSDVLVPDFLNEAKALIKSEQLNNEMASELSMKQEQVFQAQEELDYYYVNTQKQENILADYLSSDPLLKIARQARLNQ
jgi:hypothetical protein